MPIAVAFFSAPAALSRRLCISAALVSLALWHPAHAQNSPPPVEEPIIPDEEFAESIPELPQSDPDTDPELEQELESIEEFERRFDEQSATSPATPSPSELEPDPIAPTLWDAELDRPLPSLEDFRLNENSAVPALASPSSLDELRYRWRITGLDQTDDLPGPSLREQFEALSTLEQGDGKAANVAMLLARVDDDSALLLRLLKAQGWYQAAVETKIEPSEEGGKRGALASLEVERGERFTFAKINVEAGPTTPEDLIERSVTLSPGDPIIAADVLASEALIAKRLPENGYPFAQIGLRDILLDRRDASGVYTLPIEIGPRARISGFAAKGETVFPADHLAKIARIVPGDLYDSRYIDDLRRALAATGLLRSFSVTPEPAGTQNDDGTQNVTLVVDQTAGPARTLAATLGYGTGQGLRFEGSWSHRNLFPVEGALTGSLIAGTREQGASLTFRRANAGARDRAFELGASALRSDFDAFQATTGRVGALYSYVSTPIWQKRVTWAVGAEVLGSVEEAFDPVIGDLRDETYFIGALTGQVGLDTSDDLLNPTRGFRLDLLVQPEGSLEGGFTPYARAIFDASAYTPATSNIVLAGRARFGTIQGADSLDIAPSRRLYAGGGGSVRGFGFQELGPQASVPNPDFDPNDPDETADPFSLTPIGGRSVVEASAEMRYRFGDYGLVAFVDAGQVYRDTAPAFSDIRFGVGIGGRIYTSFGPLRVDLATPINRRPGESRINVYVSIGQAF